MFLYVNGDSYAKVSNGKTYCNFLAEHYNCEFKNSAINGSCNTRIFRTSLRNLLEIQKKHDQIIAIISLSFILRTELWDSEIVNNNRFLDDGEFVSINTTSSKTWFYNKEKPVESKYQKYVEQWLRWYSVEGETVNLLKEILLFTTWCKYNNIKYVIVSGPLQEPVDLQSTFIKSYYEAVSKDSNVIDIFSNSFTEWCVSNGYVPIDNYTQEIHGKTYIVGHHGEEAHRAFANFLIHNFLTGK